MASELMEERVFPTQDGNIRYWISQTTDDDLPWLVFLPGLTADHRLFDTQIAHFAGKTNMLVWDAPSHGASRPFALTWSMDDLARCVKGYSNAKE